MRQKPPKTQISARMQCAFFNQPLLAIEIERLKAQCEAYQSGARSEWMPSLYNAYAQYFGLLSAVKVKTALTEAAAMGYFKIWKDKPIHLVDIGAGTLGATLGALDFLMENSIQVSNIIASDRHIKPTEWAQERFQDLLPSEVKIVRGLPQIKSPKQALFIFVDVFNEVEDKDAWKKEIKALIESADHTCLFLFIEPAAKPINQNLLRLRDEMLTETNVLLPCPHQLECPALKADEWCHEDRDFDAPSEFWSLVQKLGFRRQHLQYSELLLGHQKPAMIDQHGRIVSQILYSKGRCDKWVCAGGKRWKVSLADKDRNETNESFYEAERGDVIYPIDSVLKTLVK